MESRMATGSLGNPFRPQVDTSWATLPPPSVFMDNVSSEMDSDALLVLLLTI